MENKQSIIEVICGPMFAGKTDELLRRLNRASYAKIQYLVFKPNTDTRTTNKIISRNNSERDAISINKSIDILEYLSKQKDIPHLIAIDEAQFLDTALYLVANKLADMNINVIVSGLDLDFRGEPFETIKNILPYAERITKLTAVCTSCYNNANRSQRMTDNKVALTDDPVIVIGDIEKYSAKCRHCHILIKEPKNELEEKINNLINKIKEK